LTRAPPRRRFARILNGSSTPCGVAGVIDKQRGAIGLPNSRNRAGVHASANDLWVVSHKVVMPALTLLLDHAANALATDGWCALTDFLPAAPTRALADECQTLQRAQQLRPARVGLARASMALRGDQTHWFEPTALSEPQRVFAERIDALRHALNQRLLLGLVESEAHYAMYPRGAGYARHLDCLRGSDARVLSTVFYLNADWHEREGGALRLYLADGSHRDIYPRGGTLAMFLSAQFEHEVLPATRERLSIACWLRQRVPGALG
jgi:SM-20-related protein